MIPSIGRSKVGLALFVSLCAVLGLLHGASSAAVSHTSSQPRGQAVQPEHVVLFVLEGVDQASVKTGPMPLLGKLVKEGSATWEARAVTPALRLPTMASLFTGMPVEKHGINWNTFDFVRGYPRPPTMFDYLDLSGGRDSAIFFMDESLYQLAKPEPYTDYQMCGPLKAECSTGMLLTYIREYFRKATSGHGYGHAILSLPHLLVVHLPEAGRAGKVSGWRSKEYQASLRSVDKAMGEVLDLYKRLGILDRTAVIVTSLNNEDTGIPGGNGKAVTAQMPTSPWIAWGVGIKAGYAIKQPVSLIDTGATVMRTLGLTTHTEWESRPVEEIFRGPFVAAPGTPGSMDAGSSAGASGGQP